MTNERNYDEELAALLQENEDNKLPPAGKFNVDIETAVWTFSKAGDPMLTVEGVIVAPTAIGRKVFHRVGLWSKNRSGGATGLNELAVAVGGSPSDLYRLASRMEQGSVDADEATREVADMVGTAINMVITHKVKTRKAELGAGTVKYKDAQIQVLPYDYIEAA